MRLSVVSIPFHPFLRALFSKSPFFSLLFCAQIQGLNDEEVKQRQLRDGFNEIASAKPKTG